MRKAYYENQGITLYHGDCLDVMAEIPENSVDTVIADPPYGLEFMGKDWDHGVPGIPFWEAVLRVAKPGAMLLAFGGTRTHHRLVCAIEDAGWEIRDCVMWLYGSGFPKSHNISKAIDKAAGIERELGEVKTSPDGTKAHGRGWKDDPRPWQDNPEISDRMNRISIPASDAARLWDGWGTALKPAWEPIIVAMKPRDGTFAQNALKWSVAGLNIDGARIETGDVLVSGGSLRTNTGDTRTGKALGMFQDGTPNTYQQNSQGRWPANVILDEEAGAMLDRQTGTLTSGKCPNGFKGEFKANIYGEYAKNVINPEVVYGDSGGASRFFYCAKSPRRERWFHCAICGDVYPMAERDDHKHDKEKRDHITSHPTQKPLSLMEYLCRLTKTPTGGIVLDPFAGSGSTLVAAGNESREAIGIEIDEGYCKIAAKRLAKQANKWKQKGLFS